MLQYQQEMKKSFEQLEVTTLFCPQCGQPVPVRKRLLLVIPDGEKYEYLCVLCASSLATKIEQDEEQPRVIVSG